MAKNFTFAFTINGLLDPSFNKSVGGAKNGLIQLKNEAKQVDNALKNLQQSHNKGIISDDTFNAGTAWLQGQKGLIDNHRQALTGLINNQQKAKQAFKESAQSAATWGAGLYLAAQPLVGMIKTSADFEKAMSKVGAIAKASDTDLARLTDTARKLGSETQFSATQAAEAMSYLGMAGWNTDRIIAGMPGLLNLAAAGNTSLALTADIVSDNLTAFGLDADKAAHMADVYATVITSTNTDVTMLGETMKYAAPIAKAFGASMEETAALTGLMANAGIKASQAGTSLRAGFLRLAGPPKAAAKELDKLGISLSDTSREQAEAAAQLKALGVDTGNLQGPQKMAAILQQLREKFREMSNEEQVAAGKAIFGANAVTGWLAVLSSGEGEFEKLTQQLLNCDGAAENMAKKMQNNAAGATVRLQSAMESLSISVGSVFLPAVANVADGLAGAAGNMAKWAGEHPGLISGVIGLTGAIGGLILVYKTATMVQNAYIMAKTTYLLLSRAESISAASAAVAQATFATSAGAATTAQWGLNAAMAANPIGLMVVAIAGAIAAGYALYKNWDTIKQGAISLFNTVGGFIKSIPERVVYGIGYAVGYIEKLPEAVGNFFATLPERLTGMVQNTQEAGKLFIDKASEWGSQAVDGLISWFTNLPGRIKNYASEAWEGAKNIFSSGRSAGNAAVSHNAEGGIYGKGAFLTTFAEESGESAIPHTPTMRNIGLLAKTNEIMGNPLGAGNSISISYAPSINVGGSADQSAIASIRQTLEEERQRLERMLRDLQNQQRRLSYV